VKIRPPFLYAVSLKGVTGMRSSLPPELPQLGGKIKSLTEKIVAIKDFVDYHIYSGKHLNIFTMKSMKVMKF